MWLVLFFVPWDAKASASLFTHLPLDARTAAMGGAGGALAEGVAAFHANPAALAGQQGLSIRAGNLQWLEESFLHSLSVGFEAQPGRLAVGAQVLDFGSGPIERVGETSAGDAIPTGATFESRESLVRVGMATGLAAGQGRRLDLGAALVIIQRQLDTYRDGQWGVDLGLRYGQPIDGFRLSFALQSLGNKIGPDRAPTQIRLGGRVNLGRKEFYHLVLAAGLDIPLFSQDGRLARVGLEYPLSHFAFLRVGRQFLNKLSRWSLGAGMGGGARWLGIAVDFAWLPGGTFGGRQVWTVGLRF